MTLGFKPQFVPAIVQGTKIHTIREDIFKRWEPGKIIHMATGVRSKAYKQFRQEKCVSVQEIEIKYFGKYPSVTIDGKILLTHYHVNELALNDGFSSVVEFYNWFNKDFTGRIIHWTGKKY